MPKKVATISFLSGAFLAVFGVLIGSFFHLAYEHNALSAREFGVINMILIFIEWPNSISIKLGYYTDFYHPHIAGSGFWRVLSKYLLVNFLGWSLSVYLVSIVVFKIIERRQPKGVEQIIVTKPET